MELRYCEECGDVIRLDSEEPANLYDRYVCPKCKGEAPATRAESSPEETESFSADDIDLFSPQSIRAKKQDLEPGRKKAPEARLRLVKARKTPVADNRSSEPAIPTDRPVAAPNSPQPGAPAPRTIQWPPAPATTGEHGRATANETSGRPAKSARKIIFRCLYCKSPISIRPVEKTSKLTCPACGEAVYVTPTGRLLKKNPSHAVRKDADNDESKSDGATDEPKKVQERLSAFEEHVFSQDPDKTAFLTEEVSPLPKDNADSDDFPLADELLSTVVRARDEWPGEAAEEEDYTEEDGEAWAEDDQEEPECEEDEPEYEEEEPEIEEDEPEYEEEEPEIEEWPGESDLLAEDEFDDNLKSGSRNRSGQRTPSTARVILVGIGLLLPFALVVGLLVTHFSELESRARDPAPTLTTLERLGEVAKRGILNIFGDGEESRSP